MTDQPTRLILLTMVKNESRIIQRLMGSVKGKCDAIVICDTGSTDNTVELAKQYLEDNKLPGGVYEYTFKTFGKSRTQSFECCQDWVKKIGWDATKCWALLLDGDMMLGENQTVSKEKLATEPKEVAGILLNQANGSLVYGNVRLIRVSEPWICKGATHEAWTCPDGKRTSRFDTPVLIDHNDGGCKADKYPRDVRLLLQDLEEMPNDARTHFYLGQTYLCMGEFEKGIPVLKKRIEIGGWDEELYITYMYLGECYMNSGKVDEAVKTWLDGWQFRQHRTEIPMKLITYYRNLHKHQYVATMFLEQLWKTQTGEDLRSGAIVASPVKNYDSLFVNKRNENFHIYDEMGILGFYTNLAKPFCLRLDEHDLTNRLGWHDFNHLFGRLHWYEWCMKPRRRVQIKIPLTKLPWAEEDEGHIWQPFNPSIRQKADKSGYEMNVRYANYYTNEAKHYAFRAFQGQVLTRNCFVEIPKENGMNQPSKLEEILIDPQYKQDEGSHIKGVEDCRLIANSDKYEFLGTSKSYADNGINKIFHVWRGANDRKWHLKQLPLPACAHPSEVQKNWMGFRWGDNKDLRYIYSFTPFRVCDEQGKIVNFYDTYNCGSKRGDNHFYQIREYRGSAGPVEWKSSKYPNEAYLTVMHKVFIGEDGRRYYHRFMTLDKDLMPSRVSSWTKMTKERVEYWSGMCPNLEGDGYWITYGLKDSEGYMAEVKTTDIEELMFYDVRDETKNVSMEDRTKVVGKYY
jgi:tetratricopeptide (TPR) repeat protein